MALNNDRHPALRNPKDSLQFAGWSERLARAQLLTIQKHLMRHQEQKREKTRR
jgi:hypothetical protein